jgi:hypothetical protein
MERTVIILAAGVLLLNFVVVPLLGLRLASRRRAAAAARRRRWPDVEGYASILLSRLMVQTCRVLAFEKACLLVGGGGGDPPRLTVVVAHGLDEDMIGRRVPVEGPLRGALQGYGPERTDLRAVLPPLDSPTAVAAGVTTPSHSLVLCAAGDDEQAEFGERESVLLGELASLCASAIEDLAIKERLDSELGGRAKDLALPSPDERRMPPRTRLDAVSLAVDIGTRLRLEPGALIELELAAHVTEPGSAETPSTRIAAAAGGGDCTPLLNGDPVATAERLARAPGLEVVALIVRCVRERWDGRGPLGLPGMQIPLASRILAACDAARVLTAGTPGGAGETLDIAVRRIQGASGTIFDPTVVTALTHELIGEVPELGADVVAASDWARADSQYAAYH